MIEQQGKKKPYLNELVFMLRGLFIGMAEIPFYYGCIMENSTGPTIYTFKCRYLLKNLHYFYAIFFLDD